MKKIHLFIFILATVSGCAQSFHRGALVLDANTGFEVYNTTSGYRTSANDVSRDTTVADVAGSGNLSLGMEIGIRKRWGLGIRGKANSFFTNVDAVTNQRADIRSTDLLLMINFHPVILKKFDLVIGSEIGFSKMNIQSDDVYRTITKGNGGVATLYLNPRFYFKRFGINLKTYLPYVTYNNLQSNRENPGEYMLARWKGSGLGVTIGVQYRFFKP